MLFPLVCLSLAAQLTLGLPTSKVTYNGHQVLEILHNTEADFLKLMQMELKYELDFWKLPKDTNDSMSVHVGPHHLEAFLQELENLNAGVQVIIEDVQELLDNHKAERIYQNNHQRRAVNARRSNMVLDQYHNYASIRQYMAFLASQTLPGSLQASTEIIGQSEGGLDIEMIKFHSPYPVGQAKKAIFLDGGIHAREWVSPATLVYLMEMLAYNPNNKADITILLSRYDVHIVPVLNPDGYEYTDLVRLWRKNRKINQGSGCVGVDLNRNFPYQWNPAVGGSTNPCQDLYSGPAGNSEKETQTLTKYLSTHGHNIVAYLTIHSYGQLWMYPWGYTSAYPVDSADLHSVATYATDRIRRKYGTEYIVGDATHVLYAAAGGSDDYAKGAAGIKYSYTVELRDTGRYGFVLPNTLIIPTAEEFLEGFLAFADRVHSKSQIPVGK